MYGRKTGYWLLMVSRSLKNGWEFFGEQLHIDQNEQFGVTHVCAVDGFSGMIVGFVTMPIKNNRIIYESLYM